MEKIKKEYIKRYCNGKKFSDSNFNQEAIRKVIYIKDNKAYECYEVTFFMTFKGEEPYPSKPLLYIDTNTYNVIEKIDNLKYLFESSEANNTSWSCGLNCPVPRAAVPSPKELRDAK